jgi:geranylgeranyl diphosphate synthase type I
VAFVLLKAGVDRSDEIRKELLATVTKVIGPTGRPDEIIFVDDVPKTRSGKIMRRILRKIAEGQQMDINFEQEETVSPEDYMEMIRLKTSILFGAAAYGGARIGGSGEKQARELEKMATNVGLGFQIWDDYLDATASEQVLGKPSGSDIRQGKKTLLVIEALNRASEDDQKRLLDILDNKDNSDSDVQEAVQIMEKCGALEACHSLANGYLEGVRDTLAKYPDGEARQLFESLLEYMVTRGH